MIALILSDTPSDVIGKLTAIHQEVIENLESVQGALLRMNRSIQVEGTFGIMKNDRWYKKLCEEE